VRTNRTHVDDQRAGFHAVNHAVVA
jgi:hypothetical protein